MNTTSKHFVPPRRVGIYEPVHQIIMWGENFKSNEDPETSTSFVLTTNPKYSNLSEDTLHGIAGPPNMFHNEATKGRRIEKIQRRLAQNREAARKSRLRKKAYVQQLETSRQKLLQLEQELERTRQQDPYIAGGIDTGSLSFSGTVNPGIATFELEYAHWVEEQNRQICELRAALHANMSDLELRTLVENGMGHYFDLFQMKATAAKADVFYVMLGMWKTSAERFFSWIGGFRPSDLIKVLLPHFDDLTDQQRVDVCSLRQSCQQAEEALSLGMDKLQQTLGDCVAAGQLGESSSNPQTTSVVERLEALISFVTQADHLRQEAMQQIYRIITTRQAACGLIALGEYFQRLRALSSLSATRPSEPS